MRQDMRQRTHLTKHTDLGTTQAAHPDADGLLATDDDIPEDCQRHRQPHGRGVRSNREVGVEQQVDYPAHRVPVLFVRNGDAVEIDGVRQI